MIYVGIDISKYKHDCCILNDFGDVLNAGFMFSNNAEVSARFRENSNAPKALMKSA